MDGENLSVSVEVEPDILNMKDEDSDDSQGYSLSAKTFEDNLRELQKNSILNIHNSEKVLTESHKQVLSDLIKAATDFKKFQMTATPHPGESSKLEQCFHCGKYYRRLARHMLKHTKIDTLTSSLVCQLCFQKFEHRHIFEGHLKSHNISGDGNTKPFICEICQKGFSQNCNLINHLRTHTGDKPFKCNYCDKRFTQSGNLKNHMRLHSDEKPYICPICYQGFRQLSNLNNHSKKHPSFKQEMQYKRSKSFKS